MLKTLEIDITACPMAASTDSTPSARCSYAAVERLFSRIGGDTEPACLDLQVLNLKGFDFAVEASGSVLSRAVAICHLRALVLQKCLRVLSLLRAFVSSQRAVSLRHFLLSAQARSESEHDSQPGRLSPLDAFLSSAQYLESLIVDAPFDNALQPSVHCFAKPTLKILMLRCDVVRAFLTGEPPRTYDLAELSALAQACPHLYDLAIPFPPFPLLHRLPERTLAEEGPAFAAFLVSASLSLVYST